MLPPHSITDNANESSSTESGGKAGSSGMFFSGEISITSVLLGFDTGVGSSIGITTAAGSYVADGKSSVRSIAGVYHKAGRGRSSEAHGCR